MLHIKKPHFPGRGNRHKSGNPGTKTLPSPTPTPTLTPTASPDPAIKANVVQSKSPTSLPSPPPMIDTVLTEKELNKKTW